MKNRLPALLALLAFLVTLVVATPSSQAASSLDPGDPCPGNTLLNGTCVVLHAPPICESGETYALPTGPACITSYQDPEITLINCPDNTLSSPDGCFVYVSKGPQGPPMCATGVLAGETCLITGGAPQVSRAGPFCFGDFAVVDGKCLRYEAAVPTPAACPAGSHEDNDSKCREIVPGGNKKALCPDPATKLTDQGCATFAPATVCPRGGDLNSGRCTSPAVGPFCYGELVTINLELGQGKTPPDNTNYGSANKGWTESYGTHGDDIIWGTPDGDWIYALGGNDIVCGGDGNDVIFGGNGNNVLFGQSGDDTLGGGPDTDELAGGPGNDYLSGYLGQDFCDGGADLDTRGLFQCEKVLNVP